MRKLILLFIAFSLISGCSKPKPDSSVLTIGLFGSFDSKYNKHPENIKKSVQLAVDNQNSKGGIDGKKIRLLIEDVSDIRESGKAVERFVFAKCDAVICAGGSDFALSATLQAEINRIPMLCPALSARDLPGKGDFTIPIMPNRRLISIAASEYILKKIYARKGAVFYMRNDDSLMLLQPFQTAFESPQKKGLTFFTISQSETNFTAFANETAALKPQFVYNILGKKYIVPLLKSLKQANVSVPVISAYDVSEPETFAESASFPDSTLFISFSDKTDITDEFKKMFSAKYKTDPDNYAYNAYDAFLLIMNAYDITTSGGKISSDALELRKNIVQTRNFDGASGKISFAKNGAALRNIDVLSIKKGSVQKIVSYGYNEKNELVSTK